VVYWGARLHPRLNDVCIRTAQGRISDSDIWVSVSVLGSWGCHSNHCRLGGVRKTQKLLLPHFWSKAVRSQGHCWSQGCQQPYSPGCPRRWSFLPLPASGAPDIYGFTVPSLPLWSHGPPSLFLSPLPLFYKDSCHWTWATTVIVLKPEFDHILKEIFFPARPHPQVPRI
jgi:hypothetical protein